MYGILCATPEERDALRARFHTEDPPRTLGPTQVWTGTHDGQAIAVAAVIAANCASFSHGSGDS